MVQQPTLVADESRQGRTAHWSNLAVVALVVLAAVVGCNKVWDSDVFWHLASGQWMLDHHAVLGHDAFSIDPPEKWINVHWLFQVLAAALYRLGGYPALVGLKMAGLAGVTAVLAIWLRRRVHPAWLMLIGTLIILGVEDRVRARPEILTFLFFSATLVLVESVLKSSSPRRLWWLAPINILWVNSHGLFFLGPAILWTAWAATAVDRFFERRDVPRLRGREALIASVVATLACFVSPWPLEAALHPLQLSSRISGDIYSMVVSELAPSWQINPLDHPPVIPVYVLAILALISIRGRRRPPTAHLFWLALFLVLGLLAMRNLPLLAIVAGFVAAIDWPWWNAVPDNSAPAAPGSMRIRPLWNLAAAVFMALVAFLYVTENIYYWDDRCCLSGFGLVESFHPIPMANFLVKSPLDGDIMPLSFGDGGVFMLYSPQRKVWMDARLELHPQERLMELYRIRVKIKRGEIDDPAQAPLPPSVRFIVARANSLDMIEGLSHSRRFRPLYVDEAGVCFARLRQRGETVTWTPSPDDAPTVASDSASLPANLRAWDKPFDPAHAQLIADAPAPVWYRNNPPALHEQVGMIFEAMGYPALAEKYLKASVALGEHHNDMARDLLKRRSRSSGP